VKLDDVAQELYGLPPERFTEMRNTRAKEIAAAGDRELAGEVRRLPKPTVAAWLANMLVRTHAATVEQLVALGPEHRDAQGRGEREDMRRVAERRRELTRQLVSSASRSAVDAGHSMGSHVQRQLEETLEAAVADDESAVMLRTGRLSSPMVFIGFGATNTTGRLSVQSPKPKKVSSRHDATDEERQAATKALDAAARSLSDAKEALESATVAVEEARRRHGEASTRHSAAAKELRDTDRLRARAGHELEAALRTRADAEQRLKEAAIEHKNRQADLGSGPMPGPIRRR
jgi:hypothetical protein